MKRILITLLFLLISFQMTLGQVVEQTTNNSQQELYDFYKLKQKKNNTTGWIMLGGGAALTLGTLISYNSNSGAGLFGNIPSESQIVMFSIGGALTLASIPFFISAGKNKRKAEIYFKGVQNKVGRINVDNSNYLAIGLTIPF